MLAAYSTVSTVPVPVLQTKVLLTVIIFFNEFPQILLKLRHPISRYENLTLNQLPVIA
jgi:hypothetical protein